MGNFNWSLDPGGIFATIGSIINTQQTNKANRDITQQTNESNERMTRETNEANAANVAATNAANREMVQMQNDAAAAEAEKAYQRSKASNQVNLMMQAGMSRAGAINALNGGGSYIPAPVNVSQDSAAQSQAPRNEIGALIQNSDLSGLANIMQIARVDADMKHQKEMLKLQQKFQEQESEKQRNHELFLSDINSGNQALHDYIDYEKHKERLNFDIANARKNWRILDQQVEYLKKQTKAVDVQTTGYELDNIRKRLENANYSTLAKLCNEKVQHEINALILAYNQAVENHDLDKQAKNIQLRWERLTQDYRINAENARNELSAYMDTTHMDVNSGGFGIFACFELFINNYLSSLARFK